jgi:hypothetical protein
VKHPVYSLLFALVAALVLWACEGQQPSSQQAGPPVSDQPAATQDNATTTKQPASEPLERSESPESGAEETTSSESAVPDDQQEEQQKAMEPEQSPEVQVAPSPEPKPTPDTKIQSPPQTKPAAVATPDPMLLTAPEGVAMKQTPVSFSHKRHSALECSACHHTWDGKGPISGCMDQGCHDLADAKTPQEKKDPTYFYNAFHSRTSKISCVGCHGEMRKAGQPSGPVGCQECHPKQ